MGGYNSGGHNHKGRPSVNCCPALAIKYVRKYDMLKVGTRARIAISDGLNLDWFTESEDRAILTLISPKGRKISQQYVEFQWLANERTFGGYQYYWSCPGCYSRRTKIYLYRKEFQCRECHRLRYSSQRMRPLERMIYQGHKAEKRLQEKKRLSKQRRERLIQKIMRAESAVEIATQNILTRLCYSGYK